MIRKTENENGICFSVLMPTFNQCSFIRRAISSLIRQTYKNWELIIINDGCTDETEEFIIDFLEDERISYVKNGENMGLGYSLNKGMEAAKYDYIAYLPSDDFYYENHLETIRKQFESSDEVSLVYTGMKYDSIDTQHSTHDTESVGLKNGYCMQLVQTAHKKTDKRWREREEWITEDLFQMYWRKLLGEGCFVRTNMITCNWTSHPAQRHKIVGERYGGGLNKLRSYYKIKKPIRLKISQIKFTDENKLYSDFREKCPPKESSLKILLVGELAYNPERIYALEQAGHKLYGLWMPSPDYSFSTVGPIPFGHITDIPFDRDWRKIIYEIRPDVIYGLLNSGSVPFVYDIVRQCPDIPYVWHFKEGPSVCLARGTWDKLIYLYRHASGRIFLNEAIKEWYMQFLPKDNVPTMIMDGDLPSRHYFKNDFSPKQSDHDGEIHTVVAGRLIGFSKTGFECLVKNKIHVHLYTESYYDANARLTNEFHAAYPDYFHYHPHVSADEWTKEFSKYDAGWLHCCRSLNKNNIMHASWDDLNMPARMSTYAAAGLPFIMLSNNYSIVASRDFSSNLGVAILFDTFEELSWKLKKEVFDRNHMNNMIKNRNMFCFDYYVPDMIEFFKHVKHK